MKTTKDGKALYLHCLPADINWCKLRGQARLMHLYSIVTVILLYKEASYKPYVIAAMIMLAKFADPAGDPERNWKKKQLQEYSNKILGCLQRQAINMRMVLSHMQ